MQTVFRWCIPLQVQATPRCYLMASCSKSTHQTLSPVTGVWKSRRGGLITEHISEPTSIPTTSKRTAEKSCSIWPAHWADCVGCGAGWRLGVHCHCGCNNLGSNRWVFWSGAEQRHYTRNATPTTSRNKSVLCNLLSNASNDTVRLSQFLYTQPVGSKDSDTCSGFGQMNCSIPLRLYCIYTAWFCFQCSENLCWNTNQWRVMWRDSEALKAALDMSRDLQDNCH